MLGSYRSLLRRSGAVHLVAAGLPARLPIATYGLGVLELVRWDTGSWAVAGVAVAAYTGSAVLSGLVVGRWVQEPWSPRLLAVLTVLDAVALVALVAGVSIGTDRRSVVALAAAVGLLLPPGGVVVRSRWAALLTDAEGELPRALLLESALDEAVFVVGPSLVTVLGAVAGPSAALLVAGAATTAGGLGLATLPVEPVGRGTGTGSCRRPRPRASWVLPRLYGGFVALGATFASIQVGVVALTRASGDPVAAGPVLTAFSATSLAAALVVGARATGHPLRHALAVLGPALLLVPALRPGALALALLLVPAAATASPAVGLGYAQATRLATPERRARVFASCGAALGAGLGVGNAAAGVVAERAGGGAVLVLGAWAALVGAATAPPRRAVPTGAGAHEPVVGEAEPAPV